jgi:CheY-like chemotaxis protein
MSEKKTILIVDDEPDVLTFLKSLFADHGYATLEAEDGIQCMRLAREASPDLITLDITMPEQSGVRSYRQLKDDAELAKIPVVIITAVGEPMEHFLKTRRQLPNPEGFMAKPIDQEKLLEMIADLLGNRGS